MITSLLEDAAIEGSCDPAPFRWTREAYEKFAEEGRFDGRRVQLIEGEIVEMAARKRPHAISLIRTGDCLRTGFGPGFTIQMQVPLHLSDGSAPEPDIAVVVGAAEDYPEHPTTALLIVEISDTTLRFDLHRKGPLYARTGILEYWVVDITSRRLIVHRQPDAELGVWSLTVTIDEQGQSSPTAKPDLVIRVADLLPPPAPNS